MLEKKEQVLDAEQWRSEAQSVISDVRAHVRDLKICENPALHSTNREIYLNLTTLEGLDFCVKLSGQGFSIVGNRHDCADNANDDCEFFETIYGLLDSISPRYRDSFGKSLIEKLQELNDGGER